MKILNTTSQSIDSILSQISTARSRPSDVLSVVSEIIATVKKDGDQALFAYAQKFDGATLTSLKVTPEEIKTAYRAVSKNVVQALKKAKNNIIKFHKSQLRLKEKIIATNPGVKVWREFRPIARVGLYVPGGQAAYPSTVLMLAMPAQIAGCEQIVMTTPCDKNGQCNPAVLVAADLCRVAEIYKIGGAQAIAALAYGTETIPKVYKIFGPGNQYVTTAKILVYGQVDIDLPAGPSEIMVIADKTARPDWVAADLLSQLEHGEDSQAILINLGTNEFINQTITAIKKQMPNLSRAIIIAKSLNKSFAITVSSIDEAIQIANAYAPEHLEIITKHPQNILPKIINVGSVFLGPYTCEPLGDYATGSNHTLPTSGFAKMFPPLSVESFGKMIQVQKVSRQGFKNLAKTVEILAETEGLEAHANAVKIRFIP